MSDKPSTSGLSPLDLSKLPRGAISMTGIPLGRNARLPSIKGPRDLTLSSGNKRVFTPNIPARRERKDAKPNVTAASSKKPQAASNNRENRSRGRGKRNFVQLPGAVFGEGVTNVPKSSALRDTPSSSTVTIQKPILKSDSAVKIEKLDALDEAELSDKFVDDDDLGEDDDVTMIPVAVPHIKNKILKKELKDEPAKKEDVDDVDSLPKIKKEPGTENVDILSALDGIEKITLKPDPGELYFLEFGNCFLNPATTGNDLPVQSNEAPAQTSSADQVTPSANQWSSIEEGCIGKLQYLRNGNCRLIVGSQVYEVVGGEPSPFIQQVASLRTQNNITNLSELGNIKARAAFLPVLNSSLVKNLAKM